MNTLERALQTGLLGLQIGIFGYAVHEGVSFATFIWIGLMMGVCIFFTSLAWSRGDD